MEAHNSTSGHSLLHWMRQEQTNMYVPVPISTTPLLNSTYHPLLVVTTSVRLVYQLGLHLQMGTSILMVTASGMAKVVDPAVATCCTFNNPPWFCKQLPQTTTDDMEVRICATHGITNEDMPVELIEIYVM